MTNYYRMKYYVDINSVGFAFWRGGEDVYITFGKQMPYKFFSSYPNIPSFDKLYISVYKNVMCFHSQ